MALDTAARKMLKRGHPPARRAALRELTNCARETGIVGYANDIKIAVSLVPKINGLGQ